MWGQQHHGSIRMPQSCSLAVGFYSAGQQEAPHSPNIAVLCGGLRQFTAGQQGFCMCWQVAA